MAVGMVNQKKKNLGGSDSLTNMLKLRNKILYALLGFLFLSIQSNAQDKSVNYFIDAGGYYTTKNTLPFWLRANQFGAIPMESNGLLQVGFSTAVTQSDREVTFSYGVAVTGYKTSEKAAAMVNELYGSFNYGDWQLDLGIKHQDILAGGLSSSNQNISMATNARSFPGYNLRIINYIKLPFAKRWLSFKGNYADYLLNDNRVVKNARLHTKSLFFKSQLNETLSLIVGLNHYAQWGGTSPDFGKQPSGFTDYLRVITGRSGGSNATEGDQINVLGNQLGSYLLQVNHEGFKNNWSIYWSHPFEDRSGRELMNYPDALYGFYIDFKNEELPVNQFLAEVTYTKSMSYNPKHLISSFDNYFNNGVYGSGWTYFGNTIGSPFFTPEPVDANGITKGVIVGDNRFVAFNIGAKGTLFKVHYKTMLSYVKYTGWFGEEYVNKPHQLSGLIEITIPKTRRIPVEITVGTAFDEHTAKRMNIGAFLKLTKRGIFYNNLIGKATGSGNGF